MRRFLSILLLLAVTGLVAAAATKGRKKARPRSKAKTEQTARTQQPARWALIDVAAACLRTEPAHSSQLETQASYGTPAKILEQRGEWYRIELPDGYKAWIIGSSIVELPQERFDTWRKSPRLIVVAPKPTEAYADTTGTAATAFDVVIGSIFEGTEHPGSRYAELTLPDGRKGFVPADDVADFASWSRRTPSVDSIIDVARSMMGVTYLWGGTTPKAIDCSGLTKVCFASAGMILPRNASDQARIGVTLDPADTDTFRRGDLLFFGTGNGTNVTHVGIYDGFTRFIHASGRVFESSFKPSHPLYIPRRVIGACRILDVDNPKGVTTFAAHPWYF